MCIFTIFSNEQTVPFFKGSANISFMYSEADNLSEHNARVLQKAQTNQN